MDELILIEAVVLVELYPLRQFFAHHGDIFFVGLFPVGALGEEDADVIIRNAGQVQFIHHVNDELVRMVPGTGDVGADDADLIPFGYHFLQRLASDGMPHALDGCFLYVTGGRRISFQHVQDVLFRQLHFLCGVAETEFEFLECHSNSPLFTGSCQGGVRKNEKFTFCMDLYLSLYHVCRDFLYFQKIIISQKNHDMENSWITDEQIRQILNDFSLLDLNLILSDN